MKGFLIRWAIHAVSLWLASLLVAGITFPSGSVTHILGVAIIFGLVNAFVRPILAFAACGLYALTLGLFHFVVNGLLLWMTAWLVGGWMEVDGFWSAFLGALVVSIAGTVLTWFLDPVDHDEDDGIIEGV